MFIEKLITILLSWNNLKKRIFIAVMDILILLICLWISLSVEVQGLYVPQKPELFLLLSSLVIVLPIFVYFDLYRSVIRYLGFREILGITKAVSVFISLSYILNSLFDGDFRELFLFYNILEQLLIWFFFQGKI